MTSSSYDGWRLHFSDALDSAAREQLASVAVELARNGTVAGARLRRRSRHASTWYANLGDPIGEVFVKVLDSRGGFLEQLRRIGGSRSEQVAAVTRSLRREGFEAPEILVRGVEVRGRELLVSARAHGLLLTRRLRELAKEPGHKRAMLAALGAEIARLHRAGYLHGDLTPYNIVVTSEEPPRFAFIDHDRTRRTAASRLARARLRNLVQLGRLAIDGMTATDRMRVWHSYRDALPVRRPRLELRRLNRMLAARTRREAASIAERSRASATISATREVTGG